MQIAELNQYLGNIDIYLLDQILKQRFDSDMKVLDAGCGEGRNLMYFINSGYDVRAIDANPEAIRLLQFLARSQNPSLEKDRFQVGDLGRMPYPDGTFDLILVSAVLHFANSHEHFQTMFSELVRCLAPLGMLFIRMTSDIGIEHVITPIGEGRFSLPDGTDRYLLTRDMLADLLKSNGLKLVEPLKSVNVQDQRCMTTLLLKRV